MIKVINQSKTRYPAAQDFLFALFSSSVFYIVLDVICKNVNFGGGSELLLFISASFFVPISFIVFWTLVIQDSANKLTVRFCELNNNDFPVYPDAPLKEKILNMLSGAGYASCLPVFYWNLNRQMHERTVDMQIYQVISSAVVYIFYAVLGYQITARPKIFHFFIALAKLIRDGSFAYSALSGIEFAVLTLIFQCSGGVICWNESTAETLFAIPVLTLVLAIGIYSATTTLYRYKKNHQQNQHLIQKLSRLNVSITSSFSKAVNIVSNCRGKFFTKRQECLSYNEDSPLLVSSPNQP